MTIPGTTHKDTAKREEKEKNPRKVRVRNPYDRSEDRDYDLALNRIYRGTRVSS